MAPLRSVIVVRLAGAVRDPRRWQLLCLTALLGLGLLHLDFQQSPLRVAMILGGGLATQAIFTWSLRLPRFDPTSALITSLSLALLLRADHAGLLFLAAVLAMASKFLIRIDGKHVFNPSNFAIVVLLLASDRVWISPSQWGSAVWSAFLIACLAGLVLSRARRGDIAIAYLACHAALLFARAAYLGDPLAIPLRQMQSGSLLLFAFFMISDPKTIPDRRAMRLLYAVIVALLAHYMIFVRYMPDGLMYALFIASPLVPLLDRWQRVAPGERFEWSHPRA